MLLKHQLKSRQNGIKDDMVFVVDDWQEEEGKNDMDGTVSVISVRLIWVCDVFFFDKLGV